MTWKETIETYAAQSNISQKLTQRAVTLTGIMEQLIQKRTGDSLSRLAAELPETTAELLKKGGRSEATQKLQNRIANLSHDELVNLIRIYTIFFHLVNSFEQHEIIRINRERSLKSTPDNPRTESIRDA